MRELLYCFYSGEADSAPSVLVVTSVGKWGFSSDLGSSGKSIFRQSRKKGSYFENYWTVLVRVKSIGSLRLSSVLTRREKIDGTTPLNSEEGIQPVSVWCQTNIHDFRWVFHKLVRLFYFFNAMVDDPPTQRGMCSNLLYFAQLLCQSSVVRLI